MSPTLSTRPAFDPFSTDLDRDRALAILRDALTGAEDGELFIERSQSEVLSFDDGRLRNSSYMAGQGFGLRAIAGEVTGYAHSTEISEASLRRAAETARLAIGAGGRVLADPAPMRPAALYPAIDPADGIGIASRIQLLREIDDYARALDPRVVQVTASIASSLQEIVILRPEGGLVTDIRPMARLSVAVIVENNDRRESGSAGGGGRVPLTGMMQPEHWRGLVDEALRIALVNLRSVP
ncbi:MAG: DNA gyrase modulator, partial [Paracoccus sp. (in: a-proteobacteria)]|nr:DNA gyrase modulator [Paracoccus sp. (in: a-proteobacteria)]